MYNTVVDGCSTVSYKWMMDRCVTQGDRSPSGVLVLYNRAAYAASNLVSRLGIKSVNVNVGSPDEYPVSTVNGFPYEEYGPEGCMEVIYCTNSNWFLTSFVWF